MHGGAGKAGTSSAESELRPHRAELLLPPAACLQSEQQFREAYYEASGRISSLSFHRRWEGQWEDGKGWAAHFAESHVV